MTTNDSPAPCPRCGSPLPLDAPEGLCPRCLAAVNLDSASLFTGEGASLPPPPIEEIAPHFPQLEILSCLGRGGMGVVYKARQKSLDRLVALKLLAPEREKDPQFSDRFAREAQALAKMSHPHIVTVHDFGQAGGFFYLLMEFVDGANLRALLQAHKFTPEQALAIVPPLCDALQYAHDRGIVHRDIKPENLLLDKAGRVKVADFGLAKMLGTPTDADESPVGTPSYMAPEQVAEPAQVDHRADIYSLGVVFYEMLTGELPGQRLEAPSSKVEIDVRLDEVVLRALEKNPELRFQQASILKTQVETIAGTPSSEKSGGATPPNAWHGAAISQKIWQHMSASEKREMTIRGLMFTVWNLATWFLPIFIVLFTHGSARWIYAALVLAGGLAGFPVWWKILLEGQCATAWAQQRGLTSEQLRKSANVIAAPLWVRLAGAAALLAVLFLLDFIVIPAAGWSKPIDTTVSFILSFGLSILYVFAVQKARKVSGFSRTAMVIVVAVLATAFWFWTSSQKAPSREAQTVREQAERRLKETRQQLLSAEPAVLEPILAAWQQEGEAAAVGLFLAADWGARPLFKSSSILSLSEAAFAALPAPERAAKSGEMHTGFEDLRKLTAAVERAGQDAAARQDIAQARKCFDALKRGGRTLDDPAFLLIVRLLGQAMEKKAIAEVAKLPDANRSQEPAEKLLVEYDWAKLAAEGRLAGAKLVQVDGRAALKIENTTDAPLQLALLKMEKPPLTATKYALAGEIKYEGVQGAGYLEMWSHFPPLQPGAPEGRFFSRALGTPGSGPMSQITGTSDWRPLSLPFDRTGTTNPPSRLEVNIFLPGRGVVFIGPLKLMQFAESNQAAAPVEQTISIKVLPDGKYLMADRQLDLAALTSALTDLAARDPKPNVIIRAEATAPYQAVVNALEACKAAGIVQVAFTTMNG